jgi:RNA polymerase sigma factor (sigma-70 family)
VTTDEELMVEFLHGSQAAMEVLVKKYYKTVFAFLYRKTGDYHLSYDLTQEVFIRVLKSLPGYRSSGKFEHWLMKIAVNLSRDYFRSREFTEKTGTVEYADSDMDSHVSRLFESSLEYREIREAVLALPEDQRESVILYYYNGYKIREISKITNAGESTVKSRIHQAIGKLKKSLLGGEYNAEP